VTITDADFQYISSVVHAESAIVLERGKEYLVESRLLPVAKESGHPTIADLIKQLRRSPMGPLRGQVIEAMTTNETSFFRDVHPFHALSDRVIPELLRARATERSLNVWCAASSSGQEPYSIAMLLKDTLIGQPGWRVRLLATDISQQMLDRTRDGLYSQLEVNRGLPAQRLVKHFTREGTQWRINDDLRRMIECHVLNLDGAWPTMPAMDVVFLRNVLIYFDIPTKQRILARVRSLLRPDGYLFLGGAETTLNLDAGFERVQIGNAPAYRVRSEGKLA
jgi:chemotaxis protein methyltransferase CheR